MRMLAQIGRALQRIGSRLATVRNQADDGTPIKGQPIYEAASSSRRLRGLWAPSVGPNASVVYSLGTLRDRSRASTRNDGYSRAAVSRHVSNLVGSGIVPQCKSEDAVFRARVHQLYFDWCDAADADAVRDFNGLQALAARGWMEGGEMFIRLRPRLPKDNLTVPLQIQLIEPELVPHEYTTVAPSGNPIRAGIEFDAIGRRAAYWCWQQRPEQLDPFLNAGTMVRVPADQMIHLYEPVRAGQIRGLPQLTQAIVSLHDIDGYRDATLLRQKLANLFVGFVTPSPTDAAGEFDPITGQPIQTDDGNALYTLEPGVMRETAPGEQITWSDPPEATGYADFVREQLMAAAVAADVPYEVLTGDMRGVNDRVVRVILQEFRRAVEQRQHHTLVFTMLRPIWLAFLDRAILAGALQVPAAYWDDPTPWQRVEWIPPVWPYLNPVQDVEYQIAMRRAGITSRARIVKQATGADVEVIDAENADDEEREQALGLRYDYGAKAPATASAPQPTEGGNANGSQGK